MKKYLPLIFALFIQIFNTVDATPVSNLEIFYVNGIQNTRNDAAWGAEKITEALSGITGGVKTGVVYNPIGFYGGALSDGSSEGCDAYDVGTGSFITYASNVVGSIVASTISTIKTLVFRQSSENSSATCIANDLGELKVSKINEENYASKYQSFVVGNTNAAVTTQLSQGMKAKATQFLLDYDINELESVSLPAKNLYIAVQKAVTAGNKVLIVAHSQGNLIANLAWVRMISNLTEAQLQKIRILNVANTSIFSPHGLDFTHNNDKEIRVYLPTLGKTKARTTSTCNNAPCNFAVTNASHISSWSSFNGSWDSHNFVNTYLSEKPINDAYNNSSTTFKKAFTDYAASLLASMGIVNTAPTAVITPAAEPYLTGTAITFSGANSTDAQSGITVHDWLFGDGTLASGATVSHTYATAGTYTVSLTVYDSRALSHTTTRSITVNATSTPPTTNTSLPLVLYDDFSDGNDDATKWNFSPYHSVPDRKDAAHTESNGALEISMNETDTGGFIETKSLPAMNNIRFEIKHMMIPAMGTEYFMPTMAFYERADSPFATISVGITTSRYPPDHSCGSYNKPEVRVGTFSALETCLSNVNTNNITSSSLHNIWVTTTINYSKNSGYISIDFDGDGVIDFTGYIPLQYRTSVSAINIGYFGWWTGHKGKVDYVKIYGQ